MNYVQTVCGPVDVKNIAGTLVHEHVLASAAGIPENYPQLFVGDFIARASKMLKDLKANLITTIVDAAPYDLGRDPKRLKQLSESTGVNIISSTGMFFDLTGAFGKFSEDLIADIFISDIQKGMAGTDIKAGIIKVVMDSECDTPGRKLQHHAAARAAVETDCPIFLHSCSYKETGRYQLKLLKEAGMPMNRVRIDHILDTTNFEYFNWLYDQGVWLGADRLPLVHSPNEYFVSTQGRLDTIKRMIDAGMADRILLSHDAGGVSTLWDTVDDETSRFLNEEVIPDGWLFILKHAFPRLIEMGVDPQILHQILFENPQRYFEG